MTWQNRVNEFIYLTSPSGIEFTAFWKNGTRSMEKAVGIHKFPGIAGAIVQDLDVGAVKIPLTFWFEGADHDVIADQFFTACAENGTWAIVHPVRGQLILQLLTVSEDIDPVDNANTTRIDTEWVQPMEWRNIMSVPQLVASIDNQINTVLGGAADQFANNITDDQPGPLAAFVNSIDDMVAAVHETLDPLAQQLSDVYAQCSAVYTSINSAIRSVTRDLVGIANLAQMLVMFPIQAGKSTLKTLEHCTGLLTKMLAFTPPLLPFGLGKKARTKGINRLATQELTLVSYVTAVSRVLADATDITTREEALYYIDMVSDNFMAIANALDAGQAVYSASPIGSRYFTMSQNFNDVLTLIVMVERLMLLRVFNLSVAKRFKLQSPRTPVEIAITEGVDLDVFIATNKIKGREIMLLPAGRELVVYL